MTDHNVYLVILESILYASVICFIAYAIIWLVVYYFHDLPINRFENRLHKQQYTIKEKTPMKKETMYTLLNEPSTPAMPKVAVIEEPKETYTREEVETLIAEKIREAMESREEPEAEPKTEPKTEPEAEPKTEPKEE